MSALRWSISLLTPLIIGGLWWAFSPAPDPRELSLGEWREASNRFRVEVEPGIAVWRGMGHGKTGYEWLQVKEEPYRVRFTVRGKTYEANLRFDGKNKAILEPQIWDTLDPSIQKQVMDVNRQRNRPEKELQIIFYRVTEEQ